MMRLAKKIPSAVINLVVEGAGPFGMKTGIEHAATVPKNQQIWQSIQPNPAALPLREELLPSWRVLLDRGTAGDGFADRPAGDFPALPLRPGLPLRTDLGPRPVLPPGPGLPPWRYSRGLVLPLRAAPAVRSALLVWVRPVSQRLVRVRPVSR
jgi:hypothetical protein